MDDNVDLYHQELYYDEAIGPHQCLAKPWWIRTKKHTTYRPRHRCHLAPLICGEELFRSIQNDLLRARHSADITTWGFDPGMVLVRQDGAEDGMRYGDLLKQIATRKNNPVVVHLLLWHDNAASHYISKNNPGYYGARVPTIGGYAGHFSEEHDRYNRAWFDEVIAGNIPNICLRVREVPLKCRDPALEGETYQSSAKGLVASIYPSHHQKFILIDYEAPDRTVGYVMGHNSTTDFWDTIDHRFRDPRREFLYTKNPAEAHSQVSAMLDEAWDRYHRELRPDLPPPPSRRTERMAQFASKYGVRAKPYQDVSLRVRGPIVYDLNHNFRQGWESSTRARSLFSVALGLAQIATVAAKAIDKLLDPVPDLDPRRKTLNPADFALSYGRHSAQLMRTEPANKEKAIKECYANLNRLALKYIFIQNQYVQYEEWATHLTMCAERLRSAGYSRPIYVFIVTSTPETNGMDLPTYDIAKHMAQGETMTVIHADTLAKAKKGKVPMPISVEELEKKGIRALMASMWTGAPQPRSADDYEETYIHSKVAIVDDAAFTIGSANLNVRSMALDSELNVLSQAMDVALELRRKLFMQCAGDEGPAQFADMKETFNDWIKLMEKNSKAMAKKTPLSGQIVTFHVNRKPGLPVI
jgi:phosphatidylserine/phosphatidylglycerophosphate/cardiolipin synthase-like enzyme